MPQYTASVTSSTAGGYLPFVDSHATGIVFKARMVRIYNTGSSDGVWVNFCTTTATTGDWRVSAGTSEIITVAMEDRYFSGLSYTSTAASAAPFRVLAIG